MGESDDSCLKYVQNFYKYTDVHVHLLHSSTFSPEEKILNETLTELNLISTACLFYTVFMYSCLSQTIFFMFALWSHPSSVLTLSMQDHLTYIAVSKMLVLIPKYITLTVMSSIYHGTHKSVMIQFYLSNVGVKLSH